MVWGCLSHALVTGSVFCLMSVSCLSFLCLLSSLSLNVFLPGARRLLVVLGFGGLGEMEYSGVQRLVVDEVLLG